MAISKEFQSRFIELTNDLDASSKEGKAELIGVNRSTFSRAYNYGILPKTPSLIKIADYFNISVEFLVGNTNDEYFVKSSAPESFLSRLDYLRGEKDIVANYELSQLVHIHHNNISQWYKLNCLPLIGDLIILADFFGVSVDYLLGRTDDRTPYRAD